MKSMAPLQGLLCKMSLNENYIIRKWQELAIQDLISFACFTQKSLLKSQAFMILAVGPFFCCQVIPIESVNIQ